MWKKCYCVLYGFSDDQKVRNRNDRNEEKTENKQKKVANENEASKEKMKEEKEENGRKSTSFYLFFYAKSSPSHWGEVPLNLEGETVSMS